MARVPLDGAHQHAALDGQLLHGCHEGGDTDRRHAEVGPDDATAGDEGPDDRPGRVDADGEADAVRGGCDCRVDPDHLARQVEERPARVSGIDGGVRLDQVVETRQARFLQRAAEAAHDADRDGRSLDPERAPDGDDGLGDCQARRVAEWQGEEVVGLDLQDREIGGPVDTHDRGRKRPLVGQADPDLLRAVDDVVVGEDVAAAVHDEPRADAAALDRLVRLVDLDVPDRDADDGGEHARHHGGHVGARRVRAGLGRSWRSHRHARDDAQQQEPRNDSPHRSSSAGGRTDPPDDRALARERTNAR